MPLWLCSFKISLNLLDYHHTLLGELPSPLFRECSVFFCKNGSGESQKKKKKITLSVSKKFSVPILLFVAGLIFIFGQDHPSGRWEDRPISDTTYLEKNYIDKDRKSVV